MTRPKLHESTEDFIARMQREMAVANKAAATPHELTVDDLECLPAETVARLADAGLPQFGIGPRRRGR